MCVNDGPGNLCSHKYPITVLSFATAFVNSHPVEVLKFIEMLLLMMDSLCHSIGKGDASPFLSMTENAKHGKLQIIIVVSNSDT